LFRSAACALGAFALGLVLFGQSPQNWNVTVRQLSPPGTARLDAWPSPLCHDRSASHDLQPYRRGDPVSRRDSAGIYASLESRHRDGRELIQLWFGPLASPWNRKRRRRHSSAIPFGFTDGSFDGKIGRASCRERV